MDGLAGGWIDCRRAGGWIGERVDGLTGGCMDYRAGGWIVGRVDGLEGGWMDF